MVPAKASAASNTSKGPAGARDLGHRKKRGPSEDSIDKVSNLVIIHIMLSTSTHSMIYEKESSPDALETPQGQTRVAQHTPDNDDNEDPSNRDDEDELSLEEGPPEVMDHDEGDLSSEGGWQVPPQSVVDSDSDGALLGAGTSGYESEDSVGGQADDNDYVPGDGDDIDEEDDEEMSDGSVGVDDDGVDQPKRKQTKPSTVRPHMYI